MAGTALEFLKGAAVVGDKGVAHVTQKDYMQFMADHGVTKDVIDATNAAHKELVDGMYQFNAEHLKAAIHEIKQAGGDTHKAKFKTVINIPKGNITMESTAAKTYPVPNSPDKVTKVMVTNLSIDQERFIDKDMIASMEAEFKKDLGLK